VYPRRRAPAKILRSVNLVAASLLQIGRGMALVGLLLGVAFSFSTRYGRRPSDEFGQGRNDIRRLTAVPLIAIGLVGAVIWIVAAFR
jgi:hypothetical protein